MSKLTEMDIDDRLEAFAKALGLHWYRFSQEVGGRIKGDKVPKNDELYELWDTVDLLLEHLGHAWLMSP